MTETAKRPIRPRVAGHRRVLVGAWVNPDVYDRLVDKAKDRGVSLSAHIADQLGDTLEVPA